MRPRWSALAPWALFASVCAAVTGWSALSGGFAFTDYDHEAAPAFGALAHGDLSGFVSAVPSYGGSFVLRAPFALLAGLMGAGENGVFVAVALPGLIGVVVLVTRLAATARGRGWPVWGCVGLIGAIVAGQSTVNSLSFGHAEELLVSALAIGAVLAARSGREWTAGVLLGLAVAGKQSAVVAAPVVLIAFPRLPWRAALAAALSSGAVLAPLALAARGFAHAGALSATDLGGIFKPAQVWWFLGHHDVVPGHPGFRIGPSWLDGVVRPLLVASAAACALVWRRLPRRADLLGLLALVFLLRCVLDPWNNVYYHAPFLLALAAWEAHCARRAPWATLAAALALRFSFEFVPTFASPDGEAAAYLAWAVPATALLALAVFAPGAASRLGGRAAALLRRALPTLGRQLGDRPAQLGV